MTKFHRRQCHHLGSQPLTILVVLLVAWITSVPVNAFSTLGTPTSILNSAQSSGWPPKPGPKLLRTSGSPLFHGSHGDGIATSSRVPILPTVPATRSQRLIRHVAIWLLCGFFTVGRKIIGRRTAVTRNDWITWVISSTAVTASFYRIRQWVLESYHQWRSAFQVLAKHSGFGSREDQQLLPQDTASTIQQRDTTAADRVTWLGVVINLLLSVGKLVVGTAQNSSALIADAGHSLSDLVSDFITLWSVQIARLPPDEDHPDGHSKFEAIGSLFLSLTLLATGVSVATMSAKQLRQIGAANAAAAAGVSTTELLVPTPGPTALIMAAISIASKEWLYRVTKAVGERLQSPVVIANAWHHRSDAYSSVLALLSIAWAIAGARMADAAAGLLVAGMICRTGGAILVESIQHLSDSAPVDLQDALVTVLHDYVARDDDIVRSTTAKVRRLGSMSVVDVAVETIPELSATAMRAVEERVQRHVLLELGRRRQDHSEESVEGDHTDIAFPWISAKVQARSALSTCKEPSEATSSTNGYTEKVNVNGSDATPSSVSTLPPSNPISSASEIEQVVRNRALQLDPDGSNFTISRVLVHFDSYKCPPALEEQSPQRMDIPSIRVDVTLTSPSKELHVIEQASRQLQMELEQLNEIQTATIFLDVLPQSSSRI